MNKHAVIVDPYSSGAYYASEFNKRGIPSVAVLSIDTPDVFAKSFRPSDFAAVVHHAGDFDELVKELEEYNPQYILLGVDSGVELADKLADYFDVPGNDPTSSLIRRDKFHTHEALAAAGLSYINQCRVSNFSEAKEYLFNNPMWPVVVKPSDSAGSDNVHVCTNLEQVRISLEHIFSQRNSFDLVNKYALVQECLEGQEWVVDLASCNSKHVVTNLARYTKEKTQCSHIVYRHIDFLSPAQAGQEEIIDYAIKVCTALGVRYGASHLELFSTARGPVLVEINPRGHGGDVSHVLGTHCTDVTQICMAVDSVVSPPAFYEKEESISAYRKHAVAHFLIAHDEGKIEDIIPAEEFYKVAAIKDVKLPEKGSYIKKTTSLLSTAGVFWLIHEDENIVRKVQDELIRIEQSEELYKLSS